MMGFTVRKLVVYTDNLNTVQVFNSLLALPAYNEILKATVDHLLSDLTNPMQLHVIHVPGDLNTVANALSWGFLHTVVDSIPDFVIEHFLPPRFRRESGVGVL